MLYSICRAYWCISDHLEQAVQCRTLEGSGLLGRVVSYPNGFGSLMLLFSVQTHTLRVAFRTEKAILAAIFAAAFPLDIA
jgi:hypothetical protein